MRFNVPPNWPVPQGWMPGPSSEVNPAWPPAPPGWQFWIDDEATSPPTFVEMDAATPEWDMTPSMQPAAQAPAQQSRLVVIGACVGVVAAIIVGAIIWSGRHDSHGASAASSNSASDAASTETVTTVVTARAPTRASQSITFDSMRDFVTSYYSEIPARAQDAFTRLSPGLAQRVGYQDYMDFFNTVASVTVLSVSPRDAQSVIGRLTYVMRDGRTDTEYRWFSFVIADGVMVIDGTERIGAG